MTTETQKPEHNNAARRAASNVEPIATRANGLLELLNSDFGMSGGVAIEIIRVELEAAYIAGLKDCRRDFTALGNEFDKMHKTVHSRYVAERIFAMTDT